MRVCPACRRAVKVMRTEADGRITMRVVHERTSLCGGISTAYDAKTDSPAFADGLQRELELYWQRGGAS